MGRPIVASRFLFSSILVFFFFAFFICVFISVRKIYECVIWRIEKNTEIHIMTKWFFRAHFVSVFSIWFFGLFFYCCCCCRHSNSKNFWKWGIKVNARLRFILISRIRMEFLLLISIGMYGINQMYTRPINWRMILLFRAVVDLLSFSFIFNWTALSVYGERVFTSWAIPNEMTVWSLV